MCEVKQWLVDYVLIEQTIHELNKKNIALMSRFSSVETKAKWFQKALVSGKQVNVDSAQQIEQVLASVIDCRQDVDHRLKALHQQKERIARQLQAYCSHSLSSLIEMNTLTLKVQFALEQSEAILD